MQNKSQYTFQVTKYPPQVPHPFQSPRMSEWDANKDFNKFLPSFFFFNNFLTQRNVNRKEKNLCRRCEKLLMAMNGIFPYFFVSIKILFSTLILHHIFLLFCMWMWWIFFCTWKIKFVRLVGDSFWIDFDNTVLLCCRVIFKVLSGSITVMEERLWKSLKWEFHPQT